MCANIALRHLLAYFATLTLERHFMFQTRLGKSVLNFSLVGRFGYLTTLYPAFVSRLSRAASAFSLPLWLPSSSSMQATTSSDLSSSTKSAIFRSNVFRTAYGFAVISAAKDTCERTMAPGSSSAMSLKNIFSLLVSGDFATGRSSDGFPVFCLALSTASKPAITATTKAIHIKFFNFGSHLFRGVL